MLDLEKLSQKDLDKMRKLYEQLADQARRDEARGEASTGTPIIHADTIECLQVNLSEDGTNGKNPDTTKLSS